MKVLNRILMGEFSNFIISNYRHSYLTFALSCAAINYFTEIITMFVALLSATALCLLVFDQVLPLQTIHNNTCATNRTQTVAPRYGHPSATSTTTRPRSVWRLRAAPKSAIL